MCSSNCRSLGRFHFAYDILLGFSSRVFQSPNEHPYSISQIFSNSGFFAMIKVYADLTLVLGVCRCFLFRMNMVRKTRPQAIQPMGPSSCINRGESLKSSSARFKASSAIARVTCKLASGKIGGNR
jgi:hypothetical protein